MQEELLQNAISKMITATKMHHQLLDGHVDSIGIYRTQHRILMILDKNGELPDNLNIMFSAWDKLWEVPNPHGLGIAYVDFEDKRLNPDIPSNAFKCPGRETTCSACGACWSKKLKAVVFAEH